MSGYDPIEARFLTLLQGLTSVFTNAAQVTRGDWRTLDGGTSPLAVLYPDVIDEGTTWTAGTTEYIWRIKLDLFERFLNDGTTHISFEQHRDAVLQHMQKYPKLNGLAGIVVVGQMSSTEILEVYDKDGGGPFWLLQTFTWPVTEAITVTGGDVP